MDLRAFGACRCLRRPTRSAPCLPSSIEQRLSSGTNCIVGCIYNVSHEDNTLCEGDDDVLDRLDLTEKPAIRHDFKRRVSKRIYIFSGYQFECLFPKKIG